MKQTGLIFILQMENKVARREYSSNFILVQERNGLLTLIQQVLKCIYFQIKVMQ